MGQKIIPIIGPPGIGKTSIYESLCKTWHPSSKWIYQEALLTPQPRFSEFNKWIAFQLQKFLGKRTTKAIPVEYGLTFIDNHQELANFCWDQLSDPHIYSDKEINKCFRAAHFLFADFCRYQAISETPSYKPCIINEGLLQKSFLIQNENQMMQDVIGKYISLLPTPYAILYFDTPDKNLIVERLRTRKKIIASHIAKNDSDLLADIEKWQFLFRIILEKMKRKNVTIYHIDGEAPIEENVRIINNLLK